MAGLNRSVAPTSDPVTLGELKAHLRVTSSDETPLLRSLIKAATEWAEDYTWRSLLQQTWVLKLDRFPNYGDPIWLPRPPLSSVTSITYIDTNGNSQTLSSSLYDVDSTTKDLTGIWEAYDQEWPDVRDEINSVTVTYVTGYGTAIDDVPYRIRHAIKLYAAGLWCDRTGTGECGCEMSAAEKLLSFYRVLDPGGITQL